jgi:hypothetical protein
MIRWSLAMTRRCYKELMSWSKLLEEWRADPGHGPIPAYSEFMPGPHAGIRPYGEPDFDARDPSDDLGWRISENEELEELRPGLSRIADHLLHELGRVAHREKCQLPRKLLDGNPAAPPDLVARASALSGRAVLALPLALSWTQDDKGRVRWTLFGASHHGPSRAFWRSFDGDHGPAKFRRFVEWSMGGTKLGDLRDSGVRVLDAGPDPLFPAEELPAFTKELRLESSDGVRTLVTFRPFSALPEPVRAAALEGTVTIVPFPPSLLFWHHEGYRGLALPWAMQIPLLQLFPRSEGGYGIRVPQSGWLDEKEDGSESEGGHRMARRIRRTHRWQRVERQDDDHTDIELDDPVTRALFSSRADDVNLYGKPMARNAQIWTEDYRPLLHGPTATPAEMEAAERAFAGGGRFGYRFFYPPARMGRHQIFWHRPLIARHGPDGEVELFPEAMSGWIAAEREGAEPIALRPRFEAREERLAAMALFRKQPGKRRPTAADDLRKLFQFRELLGHPLPPGFARRLLTAGRDESLAKALSDMVATSHDEAQAKRFVDEVAKSFAPEHDPGPALTFAITATREFEERYWKTISSLCEGGLLDKNNADCVDANAGRTGGALAKALPPRPEERQLEQVGVALHRWYEDRIAAHGMAGKAVCADHVFRWDTEFEYAWSRGWRKNREAPRERNVVMVIPGRNRGEAVIMADHYDTAYMEDVYEPSRGGDKLRAAASGADDNHSATAALMLAADVLLPLAREGKLERDVWLVHLTGEEFPADCLGARNLAERIVARDLVLEGAGSKLDLSKTVVKGAWVLDMVAHNNEKHRDVFQIAPGAGPSAARVAWTTWIANERWNRGVKEWNATPERKAAARAQRMPDGSKAPPLFKHLALLGEVRPEWEPRSALYNTDGQIFSDAGIPVALLMENYDINRTGYHDTQDTMKNIDLDYGCAVVSIAIESVALAATAR